MSSVMESLKVEKELYRERARDEGGDLRGSLL